MRKISNLKDLLFEQIHEIYTAKQEQLKELPHFKTRASRPELKDMIDMQITKSKTQTVEFEKFMKKFNYRPMDDRNWGFSGLMKQYKEVVEVSDTPEIKDASIINAMQHMNHYDIATLGSMSTYARELKYGEEAKRFHRFVEEEEDFDEKLSKLAIEKVNPEALARV
jgi:ferritin-like metal-binding protein YciE